MSFVLHEPMAIVGMACRLPGADGLEEYWRLLYEGRNPIDELPPERLDRELYYDATKGTRGKTYSTLGGVIKDRPLDENVFPLEPRKYSNWDPCHLIMGEVACAACLHAGYDLADMPYRNAGVYIGHSGGSTRGSELVFGTLAAETVAHLRSVTGFDAIDPADQQSIRDELIAAIRADAPRRDADGGPELDANAAAVLVARVLGLNGPHLVTDAACASSLFALAMGVAAIQCGQIDMAIIGGASYNKCDSLILFSQAQSCSATGSRPFDDGADGLIGSEGYVSIVIKSLARARADGDSIQAVISGLGVSSDGRGRSLWAPQAAGQKRALQGAYGKDVRPDDTQYIEAHATSTQIGDATEMEALAEFFGTAMAGRKVPIGSVKSNIGHTLETAGLASLLKVVLAIQHRIIPPTINLRQPNCFIPWDKLPFYVATEPMAWPEPAAAMPCRAGVNAFGIGGLNVHVVVDEFIATQNSPGTPTTPRPMAKRAAEDGVAVIGRGLILPGAQSIDEFAELLSTGRNALCDAPIERWRDRGCVKEGQPTPWHTSTCRGGFIQKYAFDWERHRVPPKQIAQANPLQFMLLDAARQALKEAGYEQREFDRAGTAVVVGTIFGGEFGHALVVGLRLPVIRTRLSEILRSRGLSQVQIDRLVTEYEATLLRAKPALLDETGSFTSSTLASRLSKELNLMGGAMAVDAGECSSFAALDVACNLLHSGACSQVLCAGAQRSMDLANFEALSLQKRLIGSIPDEPQSGYVPGEGVGIVLLKRLADARRDGDRVLGVIRGMAAASHDDDLASAVNWASERVLQRAGCAAASVARVTAGCNIPRLDGAEQRGLQSNFGDGLVVTQPSFISQIGHTMAAHGMVALIHDTLQPNTTGTTSVISNHAGSGLAYQMLVEAVAEPSSAKSDNSRGLFFRTLRFAEESRDELRARLARAAIESEPAFVDEVSGRSPAPYRFSIVAADAASLRDKMNLALSQWDRSDSRSVLAAQGVFYGVRQANRPRVAFTFSGLGSQYPGMFQALVQHSPAAKEVLNQADVWLREVGGETFAELAWQNADRLGTDIWATQATMLVAGVMSSAWLREAGVHPDCVCGHSFGEFAALVAAGAWTLETAIRITWARSEALKNKTGERGTLLSIPSEADRVRELMEKFAGSLCITHINAPRQTVVGGTHDDINRFAKFLAAKSIDSQPLPVPCAFHTPLMAASQEPLRTALLNAVLRPPTVPVLSNVTNRYVADPEEIRENLVQQLVAPVRYLDLVHRFVDDGITVFVEVGPRQVLTRLNAQILADRDVVCISSDHPNRDCAEQLQCLLAQLDCVGVEPVDNRPRTAAVRASTVIASRGPIEHFDATLKRKDRLRGVAASGEADWGIDAVQTTKLVGELREFFAVPAEGNGEHDSQQTRQRFSALHRLFENLQHDKCNGESKLASQVGSQTTSGTTTEEVDDLEQFLVSFVVEHTGYPPQIIQLDADFEADLGIDSIKKAQLFGELREHFSLQFEGQDRFALAKFRTLRHVLDLLREVTRDGTATRTSVSRAEALPVESIVAKSQPAAMSHEVAAVHEAAVDRAGDAYRRGFSRGHQDAEKIRLSLRDAADRQEFSGQYLGPYEKVASRTSERLTGEQWNEIHGLADGARVSAGNIAARNLAPAEARNGDPCLLAGALAEPHVVPRQLAEITRRHVLTMAPSPQLRGAPETPVLSGASLVLGTGPVAEALQARISQLGVPVHVLAPGDDPTATVAELDRLWKQGPVPHLFLVTPHEADVATTYELSSWRRRRTRGIMTPFWVCQRWIKLVTDANLMDDASLVGVTSLGGDFGFSGHLTSAEGGAITGLLKSIIIESWMNGCRTIPIKLIDSPVTESPAVIVDGIMRELAVPSYDVEIGWSQGQRSVVRAIAEPLQNKVMKPIKDGGNWVFTGGGRGITAHVAFELGKRYGLELHLIGTAPHPNIPNEWRDLADDALFEVKTSVMMSAQKAGRNPIKAWEQAEKAIEIDATLCQLADVGISARYYSCDVSDRAALADVLDEIRQTSGPIDGVLHGAGIGKDARFENKQPDKVEQCIGAKVDGTLALMDLTRDDPLQHFVAFGSISGRFGANGHTDYSLANDMTAKLVDWYRGQRPEVAAVAFHWHAWGDVGMATKPETRLALEMIGMQFMPAAEGVEHLIRELEAGAPQGEVLITDDKYYRLFYPAETLAQDDDETGDKETPFPLLDRGVTEHREGQDVSSVVLDPTAEPFLIEHRLDDRPLLPLVIGLEFLCEAAAKLLDEHGRLTMRNVEAVNGLRFHTDQPHAVRVRASRIDQSRAACELVADVNTRDGRRVEENRVYLRGTVEAARHGDSPPLAKPLVPDGPWHPVKYPELGSKFYLGPPLRCLRKFQLGEHVAWGQMVAPAIVELAGPRHSVSGWIMPSAALDACLYATGLLAWFGVESGATLPASIGELTLGRLPRAGESCLVETRFRSREGRYALFDFVLFGINGDTIMEVRDYRIVWLQ